MALVNTTARWGGVSQTLHWVIAAMVAGQFVLAELAEEAGETKRTNPAAVLEQLALLARHKSVGITILALVVLRLVWRLSSPVPTMPAQMPAWERMLAKISHILFYGLLFVLPVTGWLTSSTANYPVSWFGVFTLPDLVGPNRELHETFEEIHETCAATLFYLAILHVLAALKHQFFDRDDVLKRMLPWTG